MYMYLYMFCFHRRADSCGRDPKEVFLSMAPVHIHDIVMAAAAIGASIPESLHNCNGTCIVMVVPHQAEKDISNWRSIDYIPPTSPGIAGDLPNPVAFNVDLNPKPLQWVASVCRVSSLLSWSCEAASCCNNSKLLAVMILRQQPFITVANQPRCNLK